MLVETWSPAKPQSPDCRLRLRLRTRQGNPSLLPLQVLAKVSEGLSSERELLHRFGHGRQRLFPCEKNERLQRPGVLRIARCIFNSLPRAGVWLRIGSGVRENERGGRENVIRFCALVGERTFGIIECQNRIALASSDLTGPHDIDRRRPGALCQQRFHLLGGHGYVTGDDRAATKSRRSSAVSRCASSTFFHHSSAAAHWFVRDATRAIARHDSGSLGRNKYASRALALASLHLF